MLLLLFEKKRESGNSQALCDPGLASRLFPPACLYCFGFCRPALVADVFSRGEYFEACLLDYATEPA